MDRARSSYTGYVPLNTSMNEIRILCIQPADSNEPQRLICKEVRTVNLGDDPSYIALSYVWGDETSREDIWIQDEQVSVTSSLAFGLRAVRDAYGHRFQPGDLVYVWADSLCINQADLSEKTHQVAQMGRIYSSASLVAAWLGEAADESDRAVDAILKISALVGSLVHRGSKEVHRKATGVPWLEKASEMLLRRRLKSPRRLFGWVKKMPELFEYSPDSMEASPDMIDWTSRILEAMTNFMSRPYWHRVWTYQELALAKDIDLLCGSKKLGWDKLLQLYAYNDLLLPWKLSNTKDEVPDEHLLAVQVAETTKTAHPVIFVRDFAAQGGALRFSEAIEAILNRRTSNPLDMVYGILSMTRTDMLSDYTLSVRDLYKQAMILRLRETGLLSNQGGCSNTKDAGTVNQATFPFTLTFRLPLYLSGAEQHRRDDLESWVHDVSNGISASVPPLHLRVSGDTSLEAARASVRGNSLILQGCFVGEIKRAWKIEPLLIRDRIGHRPAEAVSSLQRKIPSILTAWLADSELPIVRDCRVFDMLRETLSMGYGQKMRLPSHKPIKPGSSDDHTATRFFLEYVQLSFHCSQVWAGLPNKGPPSDVMEHIVERILQLPNKFQEIHESADQDSPQFTVNNTAPSWISYTTQGCFVRTDGRVQPGDRIYAIPGHPAPFVLRRQEGGFKLLTWAYVSGMMQGEIVGDDEQAWLASLETLEIR